MPELPEVETVRRQLQPLIAGRGVFSFRVTPGAERLLRGRSGAEVSAQLNGCAFTTVDRRGKYLGLNLDNGQVVVVHLRMTGSLRFRPHGHEEEPFTRAVFDLDRGDQLRFVDVRKFGTIDLVERMEEALAGVGSRSRYRTTSLPDAMWHALRGRQQPIKAALLDQRNIAGIGNIYADEALFLSHLNPEAPAGSLRPAERRALHAAIRQTLRIAASRRAPGPPRCHPSDPAGRRQARRRILPRLHRRRRRRRRAAVLRPSLPPNRRTL